MTVNAVSAVLDGHHTAASAAGDHRNGFACVTAQGEQECVQFSITGLNGLDDVFLAFLCLHQIHSIPCLSGDLYFGFN